MVWFMSLLGCVKVVPPPAIAGLPINTPGPAFVESGCGVLADELAGSVANGGYLRVRDDGNSGYRPTDDGWEVRADVDAPVRFSVTRRVHGAVRLRQPLTKGSGLHLATTTYIQRWNGTAIVARLDSRGSGRLLGSFGDLGVEVEVPCSALVVADNGLSSGRTTDRTTPMALVSEAALRETAGGPLLATLHPGRRTTLVWTTGERSGDYHQVEMNWGAGSRVAGWVDTSHLQPIELKYDEGIWGGVGGEASNETFEPEQGTRRAAILAAGTLVRAEPDGPAWALVVEPITGEVLVGEADARSVAVVELDGFQDLVREPGVWGTGVYKAWVDPRDVQLEDGPAPASCATADPDGRPCQQRIRPFTANELNQVAIPQGSYSPGPNQRPVTVSAFVMMQHEVRASLWNQTMETPTLEDCDTCAAREVSWKEAVLFANRLSAQQGLEPVYRLRTSGDREWFTWDRTHNGWRLPTAAEWSYVATEQPACGAGLNPAGFCGLQAELDEFVWDRPGVELGGWLVDPAASKGLRRRILGTDPARVSFPEERFEDVGVRLVRSGR